MSTLTPRFDRQLHQAQVRIEKRVQRAKEDQANPLRNHLWVNWIKETVFGSKATQNKGGK